MRTALSLIAIVIITALAVIGLVTTDGPPIQSGSPQQFNRRVITLAPSITEIAFALKCGDRVVGVSSYCTYPSAAQSKPKVGGAIDSDEEKILQLKPDLVIVQGKHRVVTQLCRDNQIDVLHCNARSLSDIYEAIQSIGARLGVLERANRLVSEIKGHMQRISKSVAANGGRPRVFLAVGRNLGEPFGKLSTVGRDSYLTELIEIAGGESIFSNHEIDYPQIALGELVKRAPDVIIELMPDGGDPGELRRRSLEQWKGLNSIPAVESARVFVLTEDFTLRAGPRVGQIASLFAEKIHPEVEVE
jgi:iron complex transport system substrate-binding protein